MHAHAYTYVLSVCMYVKLCMCVRVHNTLHVCMCCMYVLYVCAVCAVCMCFITSVITLRSETVNACSGADVCIKSVCTKDVESTDAETACQVCGPTNPQITLCTRQVDICKCMPKLVYICTCMRAYDSL